MNSQNTLAELKGPKDNKIYTMGDVQGDISGPPHGTTPAAVIAKLKLRSFKSSEHTNEKGDGP